MYLAEGGRIRIDGLDLSLVDPAALRRQIGVVQQDSVLFSGTIYDNIAVAHPGLPLELAIEAAKLAGAHEFVCEMPQGYGALIGEQGTGMSGGQRQRIAIARALVGNPRILIFDEATSALDVDSERAVREQMSIMCRGRTVIIISHRLSAIRDADRIIAIERGRIVEFGTPQELCGRSGGYFAHLMSTQNP